MFPAHGLYQFPTAQPLALAWWLTSLFDRPSLLVYTAASHGCSYRSTHRLVEKDGGTELSLEFDGKGVSLMGKVMSGLMGWMMKGACRKAIQGDFADLKAALEGGSQKEG